MVRASRLRIPPALGFAVLASLGFLVVLPPLGDFWAARARQYAALHGVGLHYWFSWFGGTVPGNYSVLTPYLLRVVSPQLIGASATVAVAVLCHRLVRGSRHATLATWLGAVASSFSLWSGRVPFALGSALMLVALIGVRRDERRLALPAAVLTALVSPVSAAFLAGGVAGVVLHDRRRRLTAGLAALVALGCLAGLGGYFGLPGPEGFRYPQAAAATAAVAVLLLARPPAYLRSVLIASLVACPVLAVVPNGMGSNVERFTWICLPVAVAATAQVPLRRALLACATAVTMGVIGSAHDLYVAAQPMSTPAYTAGLASELGRLPDLADYRVEVVPDGTHVAAYALLASAQLARGYETQADNQLDAVLDSPALDALTYRSWLDDDAVGYVALDRRTLVSGPEDRLVRGARLPYLRLAWSDADWLLYAVRTPTPIAGLPARIVDADQSNLVVSTPRAGTIGLRVRWSRFLRVRGPVGGRARLRPDGTGWSTLLAPVPGDYLLTG